MRLVCAFLIVFAVRAETGYDAWLRYAPVKTPSLPAVVSVASDSPVMRSARDELIRGVRGMTGHTLRLESGAPNESAIVLQRDPALKVPDSFRIHKTASGIAISGADDRGVLYGTFALLRRIATGESLEAIETPRYPVRWTNEWDNLDGSIERGYGGRSIFFEGGHVLDDLTRVTDYARMLASIGVNGCAINNVNADRRILSPEFIPRIARVAAAFRPWGVKLVLSVDFGSPKSLGGLDTFDPLNSNVRAWWQAKADELYRTIPDLGGFIIKADSEGRVGPSAYGRTHADAANVVARALKPHGGLVLYRGFVYDHHMDWRNPKNDRARAAYDNFHDLDGKFDENVVIQIKNGPIDFQVREPVSPLFGALDKTNRALELQITQEYTGQARHTVFLVPMWKEALEFDLHAGHSATPMKMLAGSIIGVSNVGLDQNWVGSHMSQANLYGFGRLAWNPDLSSQTIVDEWTRQTFGNDPNVVSTVAALQLTSWRTYENYTGPLGLQTLTDIVGNHYGVAVEASERNGWGQWHRADEKGVGMDRTVTTGTGYVGQYQPPVAQALESLARCPDDLLLFFHHVPYTHKLHSSRTVIQYLYDSHYAGAEAVEQYVRDWRSLKGKVDDQRFTEVLAQLEYQAGQASVWRDAVVNWFLKESGIPDAKGRAGRHPGRYEAESMKLEGYVVKPVTPWEGASGGQAVECPTPTCAATLRFDGAPGWYTIRVQYYDQNNGVARYKVRVNQQLVDEWAADAHIPSRKVDSSTSTRRTIRGIALRPGDRLTIEGLPDQGEVAALDYLELLREPN